MRIPAIPGAGIVAVTAAGAAGALAALVLGVPVDEVMRVAVLAAAMLLLALVADFFVTRKLWRGDGITLARRMPPSFAVGVETAIDVLVDNPGPRAWRCRFFDHADPAIVTEGLPADLALAPASRTELRYVARAQRRGDVRFEPAVLRIRSRLRLLELQERLGTNELKRVYPNFAELARYAWLTGNHRLNEIGIKTYHQRGSGTDFKQLAEYQPGDPIRHIDWKATLRLQKPIVRQFQDERDQRVIFLIDCGRRMRADDRRDATGSSHFDQVLNAVMLLGYVALKRGDSVGAMTFGTPDGQGKAIAPARGMPTLEVVMGELYTVQPSPTHSDYQLAAEALMKQGFKRSLVVVITNFRDEDGAELADALKLLRSRHLVLLASLQERVVREMTEQVLRDRAAALEVASAHHFEQARTAAFRRLAAKDALMVDVEPQRLAVELVNRYNAVKKSGLL